MASEVSIVNRALRLLKVETVSAMDEPGEKAAWARDVYADARDGLLAEYPWNFAMRRADLPALPDKPVSRYQYAYALPEAPEKCLRVWMLGCEPDRPYWDYRVEGRQIVTNETAPLSILYVAQVTDPGLFPPLFVEALAAKLAAEGAYAFTGNVAREQAMKALYDDVVLKAFRTDAQEGTGERMVADDWLRSRL